MTLRIPLLLGLVLVPATLFAQDYVVRGPNVAGTATVTPVDDPSTPWRDAHVTVTFRTFQPRTQSDPITFEGMAEVNDDGSLVWTHTTAPSTGPHSSVIGRLEGQQSTPGGTDAETTVTGMTKQANGDYVGTISGREQTWSAAPDTEGLMVLMIPGLSTNGWNRFMGLPYFVANREAMRAQGLVARRIGCKPDGSIDPEHPFKTENSVGTNATIIADEVRAEAAKGNRVILFAHSKGATDATAAIAMHPSIKEHIAGMVAIQPVYLGSPVADLVTNRWTAHLGTEITRAWGGLDAKAVFDLSSQSRREFLAAHPPYPADTIPTVVLRSTMNRPKAGIFRDVDGNIISIVSDPGVLFFQTVLRANQGLISSVKGKANDGMVTLEGQTIPGARNIDKTNLDHFEPGLSMVSPHSPADLTTESMDTLFGLIETRAAEAEAQEQYTNPVNDIPAAGELIPGEGQEQQPAEESAIYKPWTWNFDWLNFDWMSWPWS